MQWFNVGKIVNTHGVKGEIRVISTTDFSELRYQVGNQLFFFSDKGVKELPLIIRTHRKHKNFDLLSFDGYENFDDVQFLKGGILRISEEMLDAEDLEENEYFYHEIIGCTVVSEDDETIGIIKEIFSTGANDVWVVQPQTGNKLLYIPYIEPVVKEIDVNEKKIIIHLMEGLIE